MFTRVGSRTLSAYEYPSISTIREWAESNIVFKDSSVSPIPGKFKIENSFHMDLIFKTLDRRDVREVYCKLASQLGKSLITLIYAGHKLDQNPAYVGYFIPTENNLSKIIQTKIDPVLKSIPSIWRKMTDYKSEKDDDDASQRGRGKQTMKMVPGGGLLISGSSVQSRKSITLQSIIFDESGEMSNSVVEEASERIKSYLKFFPKILSVSTIVHPGDSICTSYDRAECQMEYHYICPSCENSFYPDASTFYYPKNNDDLDFSQYVRFAEDNAAVVCPHCQYHILEAERQAMLYAGRGMKWVSVKGNYDTARTVAFSANSLHSMFVPLGTVAEKLIKISLSETKEEELRTFYRGWFNEFYSSEQDEFTDADMVVERAGVEIKKYCVPDDTVALYLGVDTQKDHFWYKVEAFRENRNSLTIMAGRIESFGDIIDLLDMRFEYEDGEPYHAGIRRMGIDLGGYVETEKVFDERSGRDITVITKNVPEETKQFVIEQSELRGIDNDYERVYGVRGYDFLPDESMFKIVSVPFKLESWKKERTLKMIKMGATAAKLNYVSRLNRKILGEDRGVAEIAQWLLDSYGGERDRYHIAHQLTSEVYTWPKDISKSKRKRKTFVKIKKQNHLLDCSAIIETLAAIDRVDTLRATKPKEKKDIKSDIKSSFVIGGKF